MKTMDRIKAAIEAGKTIYVSNYMHTWKVSPKTWAKFEAIGKPVFKVVDDSLYMASGKGYVCVNGCRIITN